MAFKTLNIYLQTGLVQIRKISFLAQKGLAEMLMLSICMKNFCSFCTILDNPSISPFFNQTPIQIEIFCISFSERLPRIKTFHIHPQHPINNSLDTLSTRHIYLLFCCMCFATYIENFIFSFIATNTNLVLKLCSADKAIVIEKYMFVGS